MTHFILVFVSPTCHSSFVDLRKLMAAVVCREGVRDPRKWQYFSSTFLAVAQASTLCIDDRPQ
jgi:hypothetical protein